MSHRPNLSFWQIWNMSFGFLGIQFGWGLQMANMSAIYSFLGAREDQLALLWIAAPLTGLIVQPVVGYMSDRTWTGLGRRRPYFLVGAILASLALVAMPHSSELWMAVGLLWILDASINITMEPFRAFVADKLPDRQRPTGFAVQSLFIGLGAVVASAMPWLLTNWFGVAPGAGGGGKIPTAVMISFHTGAAALFLAVLYTILTTPEYPPDDMAEFQAMKARGGGLAGFLTELAHGIGAMPKTMRQLAVVQFFTWTALFCMWIYWAPAIGRQVFGGNPADEASWAQVMEKAGAWTGVCFATYNLVCFGFSFCLLLLARVVSAKHIHAACLLVGALGLVSPLWIGSQQALLGSMVCVGIAWASILSMPYAMLSSALPPAKMGFYMGVFNFFIVIPQVLVAVSMGPVVKHFFAGNSMLAVVTGGASMAVAALATLAVAYQPPAAGLAPRATGGH
ncbi:MAG: MFS transporter [Akkermansiaceae bacterium]|jgi:maltose/moltooligosaccharide transporter|nr:MFS transporter [Akkermansiaceae bacterium]